MSNRLALAFLAVIILLFSTVAFYRINEQGLLFHDAGVNLLESKFLGEGFDILLSSGRGIKEKAGFWQDIKTTTKGIPPFLAKPAFNTALWVGSLIVGFDDNLSAKVTATAAIFNLILIFFIARKLFNPLAGVFTSALLSSSLFFLVGARSGLADQVATVSFLSAVLFYVHTWKDDSKVKLLATGFFLGLAFTTNQLRTLYMPAMVIGFDFLLAFFQKSGMIKYLRRVVTIAIGFSIPVIGFQLPYWIAKAVAGPLPFNDYWGQLVDLRRTAKLLRWFQKPWEMSQAFWTMEMAIFPLTVLIGWIYLIGRFLSQRDLRAAFPVLFSFIPFIYFSGMSWDLEILPRLALTTLPFAAICAGKWVADFFEGILNKLRLMKKYSLSVISIAALSVLAFLAHPFLLNHGITRSGYAEASRYLTSTGDQKFMFLAMEPIWRVLMGRVAYEPYDRPKSTQELIQKSRQNGIHYVIVDHNTIYSKYEQEYTESFIGKVEPAAVFDNPLGNSLAYLVDSFGFEKALRMSKDPRGSKIYIFKTEDVAKAFGY